MNLYCDDLDSAIKHYEKTYGIKPNIIYCNKNEYTETNLIRIKERLPPRNFILHYVDKAPK